MPISCLGCKLKLLDFTNLHVGKKIFDEKFESFLPFMKFWFLTDLYVKMVFCHLILEIFYFEFCRFEPQIFIFVQVSFFSNLMLFTGFFKIHKSSPTSTQKCSRSTKSLSSKNRQKSAKMTINRQKMTT